MKQGGIFVTALILGPVVFVAGLFGFLLLLAGGQPASAACSTSGVAAGSVDLTAAAAHAAIDGYKGDQLSNAGAIMNAAETLGLDQSAQILGVMTAMGESSLVDIDYGDNAINPNGTVADSIGLFQQQSSWGSVADRMDPTKSATLFFKRLETVTGWESLEPTLAIHKVQGNADPYHYAKYQSVSTDIVKALTGGSDAGDTTVSTATPGATATAVAASTGGCGDGSTVLPLVAPFDRTSNFGARVQPTEGASTWHPAYDLQTRTTGTSSGASGYSCGAPIDAAQAGTVTVASGYQISIKAAAGYTITYMHMYPPDMKVKPGDSIAAGEEIAVTGRNGPATGCHLDIRISKAGSTDSAVAALKDASDDGDPDAYSATFVDPGQFFQVFGVTLCGSDCKKEDYGQ
jgi:murein DD-endopeptidase MepM/ murein hydrolase activator NlpD